MDRWSRCALWTAFATVVTGSGCADVLGFRTFTDDGGAGSTSSPTPSGVVGSTQTGNTVSSGSGTPSTGGGGPSTGLGPGGSTASSGSGPGLGGFPSSDSSSAADSSSAPSGASSSSASSAGPFGGGSSSSASTDMGSTASSSGRTPSSSSSSSAMGSSSSSTSSSGGTGPCTFGQAYNGGGSFTYYYFGQGTYQQNGMYKTACGYTGSESGSGKGASDTVAHIANSGLAKNTYFAAIPGQSPSNFNTVSDCGACVEISNGGNKIIATVIDECPTSSNPLCTPGHLDLSTQAFNQLGYSVGNPSGTTWKFVPCPVTGNIYATENSAGQYYLENSVYPISTVNGQQATNYGYFQVNPGSVQVTSSAANLTITINIPNGGGDTGGQFGAPSGCY